eukprot:CAMPEP_0116997072 /NCGR_PEP_ID=MMETSP0472-20121206/646_1 /TAXON_ID=693140 ORGANISM="Tiarina fusus, Strain LIS" /NCGR_SAMPLE_ID=MMETSP0472 /ASSEMBLY_ACC=CAM_ASM_000603 /LENGTH=453 /DNA_ID=CAMNT_0004695863 /DNA_START=67 /DNA_END=1428 /DNA_ORIENTATION=+
MSKEEANSKSNDLSDRETVKAGLQAVMELAKSKLQIDGSIGEIGMALKYFLDAVNKNKSYQDIKVSALEENMFDGAKGATASSLTAAVETVQHAELASLEKYLHLAHLAYEKDTEDLRSKLKDYGYELQTHYFNVNPGEVGHYVALDHENKTLLIGARGTSSVADVLTDLLAVSTTHVCSPRCPFTGSEDGTTEIVGHNGILATALHLLDQIYETVEEFALQGGYKIRICGHSLGAGVASLLGILLRTRPGEQLRDPDNLQVYAVASPAVLDLQSSRKAASFITSFANKSDVVPRISSGNIEVMAKVLENVILTMRTDLHEGKACDRTPFAVMKTHKMIDDAAKTEFDVEKVDKIHGHMMACLSAVDVESRDHLFMPGRVILFYDKKKNIDPDVLIAAPQSDDKTLGVGTGAVSVGASHWYLRLVQLNDYAITHHFDEAYEASLLDAIETAKI